MDIDKGAFGSVHQATKLDGNDKVAIKIPLGIEDKITAVKSVKAGMKEVRIWKQISMCPFVLPLLDQFVLKNECGQPVMVTVTPFIQNGTLHKRIEAKDKLPAMEAWLVAYQLSLAVNYMHGFNIVSAEFVFVLFNLELVCCC